MDLWRSTHAQAPRNLSQREPALTLGLAGSLVARPRPPDNGREARPQLLDRRAEQSSAFTEHQAQGRRHGQGSRCRFRSVETRSGSGAVVAAARYEAELLGVTRGCGTEALERSVQVEGGADRVSQRDLLVIEKTTDV
jgi:hypothetical protein